MVTPPLDVGRHHDEKSREPGDDRLASYAAHSAIGPRSPLVPTGMPTTPAAASPVATSATSPSQTLAARAAKILATNQAKKKLQADKANWLGRVVNWIMPGSTSLGALRSAIKAETANLNREIDRTVACLQTGQPSPNPLTDKDMEPLRQFCAGFRQALNTPCDELDEAVLKGLLKLQSARIKSLFPKYSDINFSRFNLSDQVMLLSHLVDALQSCADPGKYSLIWIFKYYVEKDPPARQANPEYFSLTRLLKLMKTDPNICCFYSHFVHWNDRPKGLLFAFADNLDNILNALEIVKDIPKDLRQIRSNTLDALLNKAKALEACCRLRLQVADKRNPLPLLKKLISLPADRFDSLVSRAERYMSEKSFQDDSIVEDLLSILEKIPEDQDRQLCGFLANELQLTGYECVKLLKTLAPLSPGVRQDLMTYVNSDEVRKLWTNNTTSADSIQEIRERFFRVIEDASELMAGDSLVEFVQVNMSLLIQMPDQQQSVDVMKGLIEMIRLPRITMQEVIARLLPEGIHPKKVLPPGIQGTIGAFLPLEDFEQIRLPSDDAVIVQQRSRILAEQEAIVQAPFLAEKEGVIEALSNVFQTSEMQALLGDTLDFDQIKAKLKQTRICRDAHHFYLRVADLLTSVGKDQVTKRKVIELIVNAQKKLAENEYFVLEMLRRDHPNLTKTRNLQGDEKAFMFIPAIKNSPLWQDMSAVRFFLASTEDHRLHVLAQPDNILVAREAIFAPFQRYPDLAKYCSYHVLKELGEPSLIAAKIAALRELPDDDSFDKDWEIAALERLLPPPE